MARIVRALAEGVRLGRLLVKGLFLRWLIRGFAFFLSIFVPLGAIQRGFAHDAFVIHLTAVGFRSTGAVDTPGQRLGGASRPSATALGVYHDPVARGLADGALALRY